MTRKPTPNRPQREGRPVAVRDLRSAGTIAAGLCAGILGVGAIAAPLVGWNDRSTGSSEGRSGSLELTLPAQRDARDPRAGESRSVSWT